MSSTFYGRTSDESLVRQIIDVTQPYFTLKPGHVREAASRAVGFRTHASLVAHREKHVDWMPCAFNHAGFVERLSELLDRDATAYASGVLIEGITLRIEIVKLPPERQRADRYTDVQYAVEVELKGLPDEIRARDNWFVLPEFFSNKRELYGVDSNWNYRVDSGEDAPRRSNGNGKGLTAKLVDGKWSGGLFIYVSEHQRNDESCLKSVRSALARAILPVVTSGVHCNICRPYNYDFGAWRVQLTLGPDAIAAIGNGRLTFDIPTLPKRRLHGDRDFLFAGPYQGQFINGRWMGTLYTNGVAEAENPTSLAECRRSLLRAAYQSLEKAGWQFVSRMPLG